MKKRELHKSSLFLMELIIAILFFALASTVCIRFFARAYELNRQAEELNMAVNRVTAKAETLLQGDTASTAPEYYGTDFRSCSSQNAVYELTVTETYDHKIRCFLITVTKTENREEIYHLTVDSYMPDQTQKGGT